MCFNFCHYMYTVCWKCEKFKAREFFCILYGFLYILTGLAAIIISIIWLYNSFIHYLFLPDAIYGPFFLLFFLGLATPLVAMLGVKGCMREHDFHIILFIIVLIIAIVIDLTLGIWSMVLWNDADAETAALIDKAMTEYLGEDNHRHAFDRLHVHLECCGEKGYLDFKPSPPPSCCTGETETDSCPEYFTGGCLVPLQRYCQRLTGFCGLVFFGWVIFKGFGVVIYCIYYRALRNVRRERKRKLIEQEQQELLERELAARQSVNASQTIVETSLTEVTVKPNERPPSLKKQAPSVPPDVLPPYRPKNDNQIDSLKEGDSENISDEESSAVTEKGSSRDKIEEVDEEESSEDNEEDKPRKGNSNESPKKEKV